MDGPNLYLPIWFLYWIPFFLPFNYGIKWALTWLVISVFGKCAHCGEICRQEIALKSLLLTIAAEIAGLAVFYVVEMKMNLSFEFYYAHYTEVSVLALGTAMGLNYLLNYFFKFFNKDIKTKKSRAIWSVALKDSFTYRQKKAKTAD